MMNIADRIQALRKARGISQEELADRVGVSRQAVSKWEGEQSTPDLVAAFCTLPQWGSFLSAFFWAWGVGTRSRACLMS